MSNYCKFILFSDFHCISADISVHHVALTLFQELANYSQYSEDAVIETESKYHGVSIVMSS